MGQMDGQTDERATPLMRPIITTA